MLFHNNHSKYDGSKLSAAAQCHDKLLLIPLDNQPMRIGQMISLTYKILTTSQPTYLHNLISFQTDNNTRSSDVTLARPSPASSLKVTDRSFQYASPHLWNKLPFSLRKPVSPFMLILTHPSLFHFFHPSPLHFFTLNAKLNFSVNLFRHRSLSAG